MNDNDLLTMVKDSFTDLHSRTPVEQILRRGHAVRARRRLPVLTGALAVVGGAALAVTALLSGHKPASQPPAQLAAWAVTKQTDGTIRVTIRQLRDPAGLQRQLRADGVPASITLIGQQNPSCRRYPADRALLRKIIMPTVSPAPGVPRPSGPNQGVDLVVVLVIRPSALPGGVGIQLATDFTQTSPSAAHEAVQVGLVYATSQCTGS